MHDTTIDADLGSVIREKSNVDEFMNRYNFTKDEVCTGVWPAITEFLNDNKNFVLEHHYVNNNGLTILKKNI